MELIDTSYQVREEVCVLYRSLAPSSSLIKELIKRDYSFTAQVKIPIEEDPIIALFVYLINFKFQRSLEDSYGDAFCKLLEMLGASSQQADKESFYRNCDLWGVANAYNLFLSELGISVSNIKEGLGLIKALSTLLKDDYEQLLQTFKLVGSNKYSLNI